MKATSLFGGVQVFNIFIAIIRSKLIAILLGPTGIGINGLLNSTVSLISGITNFGLGTSAVKSIAMAMGSGDEEKIATVVSVLKRLVWITGLLGLVLTVIFSPYLSVLAFGNKDYTIAFIWISITLLLNQISIGQGALLRGMRKLKYMASSALSGSIIGLFVSIPIYYKWGIDGIVPAIILTSIASLIRSWYFANKVKITKVNPTKQETVVLGKEMLIMGFMLSISSLYVLLKSYGIRAFISNSGGVEEVGLYTAGFAMINTYVGMVFSAMGTDYFPRLSGVVKDKIQTNNLINQQAEIALLIITPILVVFLVFIKWIILILYSSEFLGVYQMVQWASIGVFFKTVSWSIGYVFLAKGDNKIFLLNELLSGTITFVFSIIGYQYGGLEGVGIAYFVGFVYHLVQVFLFSSYKYEFKFKKDFWPIFLIQFVFLGLCFIVSKSITDLWLYLTGLLLIIISTYYSILELNKRIGLKELVIKYINKKK